MSDDNTKRKEEVNERLKPEGDDLEKETSE